MQERGVSADHSTISRRAMRLLALPERAFRQHMCPAEANSRMDEMDIKVPGRWETDPKSGRFQLLRQNLKLTQNHPRSHAMIHLIRKEI
jgi:hypothetical protein